LSVTGLTDRAAAKLAGCSHVAIAKAKKRGRLLTLFDGSIDPDALQKWQRERRAPRGGNVSGNQRTVTTSKTVATDPVKLAVIAKERSGDPLCEEAISLLTDEGVFANRADAERHRDSYVARLRQLEYEEKAGKLLPADAVREAISVCCNKVKTRLLAMPSEIAPAVYQCGSAAKAHGLIAQYVDEALAELVVLLSRQPPPAR
jgi:geranylgeranyl pyrophosphate synthase